MLWAFSDESRRGRTYVVAAVVVETHEVATARAELRRFLRPNQRRIHMGKESGSRRKQFLAIVERAVAGAYVVEVPLSGRSIGAAREAAMRTLARTLVEASVATWHIEWMVDSVERRDRRAIASEVLDAEITYDHRPPHDEPLLWAADALAWSASRQPVAWATTTVVP
jgi:hypothetical protein